MGTALGSSAPSRRIGTSGIHLGLRHQCSARGPHLPVYHPNRTHGRWAAVAAAPAQLSHEHSTHESSNRDSGNGVQINLEREGNIDVEASMQQAQQTDPEAEGMPCIPDCIKVVISCRHALVGSREGSRNACTKYAVNFLQAISMVSRLHSTLLKGP